MTPACKHERTYSYTTDYGKYVVIEHRCADCGAVVLSVRRDK